MLLKRGLAVMSLLALVAAVAILLGATESSAEPQLAYSANWNEGTAGWSSRLSLLHGARTPQRIFVGDKTDLADYAMYFNGNCGWGMRGSSIGNTQFKVSIVAALFGSHRNALSMNVRDAGGGMVYKYSFGSNGRIIANCQPPNDQPRYTDLVFREGVPYELYSVWLPGTGRFALGMKNLVTGEDKLSGALWRCKGGGSPAWLDLDQEGGYGPAALADVKVYLGE